MNRKIISIVIMVGLILGVSGVCMAFAYNNSTTQPNNTNITNNGYSGKIYVSTTGNDSNTGFTPETSKKSIKKAVDKAPEGATVLVAPGTYNEDTIYIKKSINLTGSGQNNTLILVDGRGIRNEAEKVTVKDFTLRQTNFHYRYGGIVNKGGFLTVERCTVLNYNSIDSSSIYNTHRTLVVKDCTYIDHKSLPEYERSLK
jgi:hypothetical protein